MKPLPETAAKISNGIAGGITDGIKDGISDAIKLGSNGKGRSSTKSRSAVSKSNEGKAPIAEKSSDSEDVGTTHFAPVEIVVEVDAETKVGTSVPSSRPVRRAEFEDLYSRYSREVWAIAYGRWTDADLAMDVTQETFLRLWRHLEDSVAEEIQNHRAWLLRVARNLAEDYAKSAFRRNGTQPPDILNGVGSHETQPLEQLERAEAFEQIRAVMNELPAADREIISLRYTLDYDVPTIAEMLGINVTAVHMRLSRARQRLAERLTARGV